MTAARVPPVRLYFGRALGRTPFLGVAWRWGVLVHSRMLVSFGPWRIYPWTHRGR